MEDRPLLLLRPPGLSVPDRVRAPARARRGAIGRPRDDDALGRGADGDPDDRDGPASLLRRLRWASRRPSWRPSRPPPTTQGYTDFLVRTAAQGDFAELAAALLPCMWGYAEIGQALSARGRSPDDRYARWVQMYASAEFAELADWCRALVDRLGAGLGRGCAGATATGLPHVQPLRGGVLGDGLEARALAGLSGRCDGLGHDHPKTAPRWIVARRVRMAPPAPTRRPAIKPDTRGRGARGADSAPRRDTMFGTARFGR